MHPRKCEVIHTQDQSRPSLSIKLPNNVHYIAEMNKWFPNANQLPTHINVTCLCSRYKSQYRLSPCSLYWCAGNNGCNGVGVYDITFGACCSNVHCAAESCTSGSPGRSVTGALKLYKLCLHGTYSLLVFHNNKIRKWIT